MRTLLLLLSLVVASVSLLTWVRAPNYVWTWKLAILAGEFGHWLVLLPLGLAAAIACGPADAGRSVGLVLCVVATAGFLRPVVSARRLAATLPRGLQEAFGGPGAGTSGLDLLRLYRGRPVPGVRVVTETFAQPEGEDLKLDFYAPAQAGGTPRPCVVVIHGGGWDGGDRAQLAAWNARLVAQGYAVAAVSYRLAPRWIWPAQRDDVLAALAWLKAHAVRLQVDPTRFVLLGRSAGGQLATAVGYGARDPALRGVIALYAPHDMPFAWSVSREDDALNSVNLMRQYFGGPPDTPARLALYESASGQLLARPDSPPTLLVHGEPDTLAWHRHSERLTARLQEHGVPHYYLRLPWATHGFDFNPDGPGGQLAGQAIGKFLADITR
ncbi:MAG: alpha/beta hydrolase [Lacunisphaera sp.]|nr:alpha/beta hydrolase [Lacunisphaera sp.]